MAGAKDSNGEPAGKKAKVEDSKNMSSKTYLDTFVVPQLLPALTALSQERPENPIEYLANYLIKHKKSAKEDNAQREIKEVDISQWGKNQKKFDHLRFKSAFSNCFGSESKFY